MGERPLRDLPRHREQSRPRQIRHASASLPTCALLSSTTSWPHRHSPRCNTALASSLICLISFYCVRALLVSKERIPLLTLGKEVRRLREGKGLTQAQLAASSHLGMTFIWGVENDREMDFSAWELQRLARTLGVSERALLDLVPLHRRRHTWPSHAA